MFAKYSTSYSSPDLSLPPSSSGSLLYYSDLSSSNGYTVTYDDRSFIIGGNRTLLLSGSVHYPRSTPGMWDGIFQVRSTRRYGASPLYATYIVRLWVWVCK